MLPRTPSRMVMGHLSPHFLPLGVSISRRTEWGMIGPRDKVFPGPAVDLDGPGYQIFVTEQHKNNLDI